jgi:large subunit ribosomal protein LP1
MMRCDISEGKSDDLIKAASVTVEPFWPSLFAKTLTPVNIGSPPGAGAKPAAHPIPSTAALPAEEKKAEAEENESEESA